MCSHSLLILILLHHDIMHCISIVYYKHVILPMPICTYLLFSDVLIVSLDNRISE